MKTVIATIETSSQPFPAGTSPAGIQIILSGGTHAPVVVSAAPYSATFEGVAPGVYTLNAQAIDANGAALGAPAVSAEFTVEADSVNVDVPVSISVSFQ